MKHEPKGVYLLAPPFDGLQVDTVKLLKTGRYSEAAALILPLARAGDNTAILFAGWMHYYGKGVEKSKERATEYFRSLADKQVGDGFYYLGVISHLAREYACAASNYRQSIALGGEQGHYELGLLLTQGRGAARSLDEAYDLFLDAEKHGNLFALKARAYFLINDYSGKGFLNKLRGYVLLVVFAFRLPFWGTRQPFRFDGI